MPLNSYSAWEQLFHAEEWLLFPQILNPCNKPSSNASAEQPDTKNKTLMKTLHGVPYPFSSSA
ncbi:MAG: hypothetical protein IJ745_07085 [Bacteroidales bacterium]|nr:hypothetical protein [Bacteroidales bacterium]